MLRTVWASIWPGYYKNKKVTVSQQPKELIAATQKSIQMVPKFMLLLPLPKRDGEKQASTLNCKEAKDWTKYRLQPVGRQR